MDTMSKKSKLAWDPTHPPPIPQKRFFWGSKYPISLHIYMFYVPTVQDHVLTIVPHANMQSNVGVLMDGFES
jgi:hypothetical protein